MGKKFGKYKTSRQMATGIVGQLARKDSARRVVRGWGMWEK